jgi:transcriptional antiterminator NusG
METKWYTVKVQSNREKIISERLKMEMTRSGADFNVVVPMEKIYFAKNGKKAHREKITYPGYIFIETASISSLQEVLKGIPGNSGVLKSKDGTPSMLKQNEIDKLVEDINKPESDIDLYNFVVGELVSIVGGPFDTFKGEIDEINRDKGKVRVTVPIFGRPTPVDLQLDQIQKILI